MNVTPPATPTAPSFTSGVLRVAVGILVAVAALFVIGQMVAGYQAVQEADRLSEVARQCVASGVYCETAG